MKKTFSTLKVLQMTESGRTQIHSTHFGIFAAESAETKIVLLISLHDYNQLWKALHKTGEMLLFSDKPGQTRPLLGFRVGCFYFTKDKKLQLIQVEEWGLKPWFKNRSLMSQFVTHWCRFCTPPVELVLCCQTTHTSAHGGLITLLPFAHHRSSVTWYLHTHTHMHTRTPRLSYALVFNSNTHREVKLRL